MRRWRSDANLWPSGVVCTSVKDARIDPTEMRKVRRFLRVVERIWNVTLLVNILAFNLTCVHGGFGFSGTEMCRPLTYGRGNAWGFQY